MRVFERLRERCPMRGLRHRVDEATPGRIKALTETPSVPVVPIAGDASLSGLEPRKLLCPEIANLVPGI